MSDRHQKRAWELIGNQHHWRGPHETMVLLCRAIEEAEREGMRRAAEIARFYPFAELFEAHKNHAVACNASQNIADAILAAAATP